MQRLGAVFADEFQIGFPHVGADEDDFGNDVLAHSGEASLEGFDGSFFAYPEKAGHAQVDLVDGGEIFVTSGVLDFVDSNGVNLAEHPVLQAPGDHECPSATPGGTLSASSGSRATSADA